MSVVFGKIKKGKFPLDGGLDFEGGNALSGKSWPLVRTAHAISQPLGAACGVFAILVLAGYLGGVEELYRPIAGGPATNPLTATSILVLGVGLALGRVQYGIWPQRVLGITGLVVTSTVLLDAVIGTHMSHTITPFQATVSRELARGKSNSMGVNSAAMLFLISLALALNSVRRTATVQAAASLATVLPMISFAGYAYGLKTFYGQMSLITATAGLALSVSALFMTSHRGVLRAVLSPYIGGRIARAQVFLGAVVPFVVGFLIIKSLIESVGGNFVGIFVVATGWFIAILVCASAVVQEKVDSKRREAERRLRLTAMKDPLTDLPNRRKFFEVGEHEMNRAHRTGTELWVLMIDIDYFKKVNDTAGHAMGDRILRTVAKVLAGSLRAIDLEGRIGGEEFAVLLADVSSEGARTVAEKIRKNIEALTVEGWTDLHGPITVSVGCAGSKSGSGLEEILSVADDALYTAKEQGRNRVVVAA